MVPTPLRLARDPILDLLLAREREPRVRVRFERGAGMTEGERREGRVGEGRRGGEEGGGEGRGEDEGEGGGGPGGAEGGFCDEEVCDTGFEVGVELGVLWERKWRLGNGG